MKKLAMVIVFGSSLVALAQSNPKAVLLEVYGRGASVAGVFQNGRWTRNITEPLVGFIASGRQVSLFAKSGFLGYGKISGELSPFENCSMTLGAAFSSTAKQAPTTFGLIAPWKAVPRAIQVIPNSNATYQKVVADELKTRGIKAPVVMTQIFKTDLDNDGTDEVILVAQRPAINANANNPTGGGGAALKAYDYALVMVRKLTSSGVKNFVLSERHTSKDFDNAAFSGGKGEPPPRFATWLTGIADTDGDGKMELLLQANVLEFQGTDMYGWKGKTFSKVFSWGC